MFSIAWKPIVSATCYAFSSFRDDYMIQRAIGGINHCAALAARFDMPEVFDFLILSLSRVSGLVQAPSAASEVGNFPVVDVEGQKITVSPLAVRFGMNVKAQLAAVVLFAIANNNGRSIRRGWTQIFEIYQTLFTHSLLPPSMLMMEDFLSGTSAIPLKPKTAPTPREERRGDGGLLSTLSSYLLSPYGPSGDMAGTDFTDDDVETTLSAVDCIASCHVDELYSQILCVSLVRLAKSAANAWTRPAATSRETSSSLLSRSSSTSSSASRSTVCGPGQDPDLSPTRRKSTLRPRECSSRTTRRLSSSSRSPRASSPAHKKI